MIEYIDKYSVNGDTYDDKYNISDNNYVPRYKEYEDLPDSPD